MAEALLVLTNVPDSSTARRIAQQLLEHKLAACVNLIPAVQSMYRWQDRIEKASEVSLFIKTTPARYAELEAAIKAAHPYLVPEIIALPIVAGLPAYLDWLTLETKKDVHV